MRELMFPRALGRNYHWLWSAATIANLGDGILLAAGPLLAASLTREPFAVAMAVFAQRLPWMLFGVLAVAIIDRLDRRTLVIVVDGLRVLVLGGLALAVALDAMVSRCCTWHSSWWAQPNPLRTTPATPWSRRWSAKVSSAWPMPGYSVPRW
ncbi:MFS transporter [Micrococcaceae bacterium Sec5.7]